MNKKFLPPCLHRVLFPCIISKLVCVALLILNLSYCSDDVHRALFTDKGKVLVADATIEGFKGKVKTVQIKHGETYEYNIMGFKIKTITPDGQSYDILYNTDNFITRNNYDGGYGEYQYDKDNRLIREVESEEHGNHSHVSITTYHYTSPYQGNFKITNEDNHLIAEGSVTLNGYHIIIQKVTRYLNEQGEVSETKIQTYSNAQFLLTEVVTTQDGKKTTDYQDSYSHTHQKMSNKKRLHDGTYATLTNTYGEHSFLQTREEYYQGVIYYMSYTYELDKVGNWTKKTETTRYTDAQGQQEESVSVEERVLTYYP